MASILLIGGNGSLARAITTRFTANNYTVWSIIRSPSQVSSLKALGASPIVQSVETTTVSDFASLITRLNPTAVIWSAGAGGPSASTARLKAVDTDGHIKLMDAVAQAALETGSTTRRFITISSLDVRDENNKPIPAWYSAEDREYSAWAWDIFRQYFNARLISDRELVEGNEKRGLEWTIVRPGWMSGAEGKGKIRAGRMGITGRVSREDVAEVVEVCLGDEGTVGKAFDVTEGEVDVKEAVERAEDCFAGFY